MENRYESMTYPELLHESDKCLRGKEARQLHRALKKYGSGLPMFIRYPNLPIWFSIIVLLLLLLRPILRGILQ